MSNVVEVNHPLARHHLTRLRDRNTQPVEFRASLNRLATLIAYAATADLAVRDVVIQTPLTSTTGSELIPRIALIPILRAGLGMTEPLLDLLPSAEVWHLGIYRDEDTAKPVEYYCKIPKDRPVDVAIVLDPMLATGGSAAAALSTLLNWHVPIIKLISAIAADDGIKMIVNQFPQTQIYVGAIDRELNANKYIVPGLGDAGDRTFNTVPHVPDEDECPTQV